MSRTAMTVQVVSFAYRYGLPADADMVLDVRFLTDPHYDAALRPYSGREPQVRAAVVADPDYTPFVDDVAGLLARLTSRYERDGRRRLTLAIGCAGGRHRSVVVAEDLTARLVGQGRSVIVRHRDLDPTGRPAEVVPTPGREESS